MGGGNGGALQMNGARVGIHRFFNLTADNGGAMSIENSRLALANITFDSNSAAAAGGVIFLNHISVFNATNIRIKDSYADSQGGCLYSYGGGVAIFEKSLIDHCYSPTGFGGFAVMQADSELYIYNTVIQNTAAGWVGGAVLGIGNSTIVLDRGSVAFQNEGQSKFSILGGSQVINCKSLSSGGVYHGDSVISGNSAIRRRIVITNTVLSGNRAKGIGGAIHAAHRGNFVLNGPITLTDNQAEIGGAISVDTRANVTIVGTQIDIRNNNATVGPLAAILSVPGGYLLMPGSKVGNSISGNIYVEYTATSLDLIHLNQLFDMPEVKLFGKASQLNIANITSLDNSTINFASKFPTFSVNAQDPFGNPVPVRFENPVIVSVTDAAQKAVIEGETIKAILDKETNAVQFIGLKINKPGTFDIKVSGMFGLDLPPGASSPTFRITVAVCNAETEMLYPGNNLCVQIVNTPESHRVWVACAGGVATIFLLANLLGLQKYSTLKLIRSNSIVFLSMTCVGGILCLFSLVTGASHYRHACMISISLDNIGFALMFGALCVKSVRIQILFDEKRSQKSKMGVAAYVSDTVLTLYVLVGCIMMILFLVAWMVVSSPDPIPMITADQAVTQRCHTGTNFGIAITLIRIVIIFFAGFLAYQIRNVPSVYNESKILGFATYNWFIFSALLNALVEFSIADPSLAFVINAVAILVPTIITVGLLVSHKLKICITNPDAARMITGDSTQDSNGTNGGTAANHDFVSLGRAPSAKNLPGLVESKKSAAMLPGME
ncbi:7 transmembrane sweet-taste receptor of 3 GCPR-domain-containing protein [Obelidium mucronatum]|nr:7 transmembrane sweet-taste receptor of 3 GCPR-domain-containing protein [Obelidium mucronatum]